MAMHSLSGRPQATRARNANIGSSNAGSSSNGILSLLRTTLSLVLISLLLFMSSFSVYLQMKRLNECTGGDFHVRHRGDKEEEINKPLELRSEWTRSSSPKQQTMVDHASANANANANASVDDAKHRAPSTSNAQSMEAMRQPPPDDAKGDATTTTKDTTETTNSLPASNNSPILVWTTMKINGKEPCDIDCEYTSALDRRIHADAAVYENRGYTRPSKDDKFSIYLQMEGEHYYPIRMNGYDLENSYNWRSPLLKPYFEWIHYLGARNISNPPVSWNSTIDGATFIARNCNSRNNREDVVQGLREAGIRVDGLSGCLNSMQVNNRSDKITLMKPYKFNLAFENGNVVDYVTEKVYEALASGVLPVYMGAPNIQEYVPDNSIINFADFDFNTTRLAWHLQECMRNESLYYSYHAWRSQPLPDWFVRKFNFTWTTTECRTCRYMHALKNGWDWDKFNQRGIPPTSSSG